MQPLWKPAQPQCEQRQLIPPGSFFLFLPQLFGKTTFCESHSEEGSIILGMKVLSTIPWDSQFSNFVSALIKSAYPVEYGL
jgi:hypothetical protein